MRCKEPRPGGRDQDGAGDPGGFEIEDSGPDRIDPDMLAAHPTLLNVANGVLDLETGELDDHDPELLLTKLAPAAYHPDATAGVFEGFLGRISAGARWLR